MTDEKTNEEGLSEESETETTGETEGQEEDSHADSGDDGSEVEDSSSLSGDAEASGSESDDSGDEGDSKRGADSESLKQRAVNTARGPASEGVELPYQLEIISTKEGAAFRLGSGYLGGWCNLTAEQWEKVFDDVHKAVSEKHK